MSSWESKIKFETFCNFLEKLIKETRKQKKIYLLHSFFKDCRSLWSDHPRTDSLYPIVRLLLPNLDRNRKAFGIKETVLAKLYIDMLSLGSDSKDAIKLKTYRVPKAGQSSAQAGDFASILYEVIKDRSYEGSSDFSVADFNEMLDKIAAEGTEQRQVVLGTMFRKMNAIQQKWTVRVILRDTKLGLGLNTILDVIHDDAKEYYESHANLRMVCEQLRDRSVNMNEISIQLMDPFKPMLADRMPLSKVESFFGGEEFFIEKKYDGERLQIHFQRYPQTRYKFFSRNGFDFSEDFLFFQEHILNKVFSDFTSLIVDGEICSFNRNMNLIMQKGDQYNIRAIKADDPDFQQCFCIYDILLLNGVILTNRPFKTRLALLRENFEDKQVPGRFLLADNWKGKREKDAIDALNDAMDRREEGIVLKNPSNVYKPGARVGGGWIKLKPEYAEQLVDTLDLIILGGYYGSGKRVSGLVSHFMMGVLDDKASGDEPCFLTFSKVGSGYSMRELLSVLQRISPHFSKTLPEGVRYQNKAGGRADVWIDPKKSVILQVKATEFIYSDRYATGFSLRFPRVERVREDKSWNDCMTLSSVLTLRELGNDKLNVGGSYVQDDGGEGTSELPSRKRAKRGPKVSSSLQGPEKAGVMIQSVDLKDKILVVEPAGIKLKKTLEEIIIKFGGTVEQNVREDQTFAYVETGIKIRAKGVIKSGKYDVVKSSWLLDCNEKGYRAFGPSDMIYTTPKTMESFKENYDQFDDPYFERSNLEGLRSSISNVKGLEEEVSLGQLDIAEFEDKFYSSPYPYGIFRHIKGYFDVYPQFFKESLSLRDELHPLVLASLGFEFYGGSLEPTENGVSHVFVDPEESERLSELKAIRRSLDKKFHILDVNWIMESIENGAVLPEVSYLL